MPPRLLLMELINDKRLHKAPFGDDFHWGVSTAAFQMEGAHDADGKGLSIWDVFTEKKSRIKGGHHARTACDFYNCYKSDIQLIKELNIPNFRFSVSWPRVIPNGTGPVNRKGIDYYNRVIDFLLECNIKPWVTLYHWDLPHALDLKGGWANRDIVPWFEEYTALCAQNFGDRVTDWMVMNEPSVFTGAGYFLGIHAPGKRGIANFTKAIHHATLATAAGARILRSEAPKGRIGTTFSCTHIEPATQSRKDIAAAQRVDTLLNRTFIEPILGMGYPKDGLPVLKRMERQILPGDEERMAFDFDFIGLQCYTREIVKASLFTPYIGAALVNAEKRNVPTTEMGWEVYPQSIYHLLKKFSQYKNINEIIITENGAAFPDRMTNGEVKDLQRVDFLKDHLEQLLKAKQEGVNVNGYFIWTLADNFEWAEGYHPRFGLVHIDHNTQQRTIKESGLWYRDFLGSTTETTKHNYNENSLCHTGNR